MKIKRLTATFGRLENETLRLEPGLNIIEAPNERGKSTWTAFLRVMLYGLNTRDRSANADKRRYLPWSGSAMQGVLEADTCLGDVTITRSTVRLVGIVIHGLGYIVVRFGIDELCQLALETKFNSVKSAVSVLGYNEVSHALDYIVLLYLFVGRGYVGTINKHYYIGVLLYRTRFAQVGKLRFFCLHTPEL